MLTGPFEVDVMNHLVGIDEIRIPHQSVGHPVRTGMDGPEAVGAGIPVAIIEDSVNLFRSAVVVVFRRDGKQR